MLAVAAAGVLLAAPLVSAQLAHRWAPAPSGGVYAGPTTCATGSSPYNPAYDPVTHTIYVPNLGGASVTVLNDTCTLVGTVSLPTGAAPEAAAFDPANNEVYVTDDSLNHVYAIQGLKVLHTISNVLLTDPIDILWDPGDNLMLVTNSYAGFDVVGIHGSSVAGAIAVGSDPEGMCFDPYFNHILVVNDGSSNVTVLNAYTPLSGPPVANINVGFDPTACAYDPADTEDYVVNFGDDNVSVIYGTGVYGSVNVGSLPRGIVWDQNDLRIYVANTNSGNISEISGFAVAKTLTTGIKSPEGLAYDEFNDKVYVASFSANKVYVEP